MLVSVADSKKCTVEYNKCCSIISFGNSTAPDVEIYVN
jgi:hypothetical protein